MISNSLLEQVYQETATNAKELVASAANVAILCDGWSNIRYNLLVPTTNLQWAIYFQNT